MATKRTKAEIVAELEALETQYANLSNQFTELREDYAQIASERDGLERKCEFMETLQEVNERRLEKAAQLNLSLERERDDNERYIEDIKTELEGQREVFANTLKSIMTTCQLSLDALCIVD